MPATRSRSAPQTVTTRRERQQRRTLATATTSHSKMPQHHRAATGSNYYERPTSIYGDTDTSATYCDDEQQRRPQTPPPSLLAQKVKHELQFRSRLSLLEDAYQQQLVFEEASSVAQHLHAKHGVSVANNKKKTCDVSPIPVSVKRGGSGASPLGEGEFVSPQSVGTDNGLSPSGLSVGATTAATPSPQQSLHYPSPNTLLGTTASSVTQQAASPLTAHTLGPLFEKCAVSSPLAEEMDDARAAASTPPAAVSSAGANPVTPSPVRSTRDAVSTVFSSTPPRTPAGQQDSPRLAASMLISTPNSSRAEEIDRDEDDDEPSPTFDLEEDNIEVTEPVVVPPRSHGIHVDPAVVVPTAMIGRPPLAPSQPASQPQEQQKNLSWAAFNAAAGSMYDDEKEMSEDDECFDEEPSPVAAPISHDVNDDEEEEPLPRRPNLAAARPQPQSFTPVVEPGRLSNGRATAQVRCDNSDKDDDDDGPLDLFKGGKGAVVDYSDDEKEEEKDATPTATLENERARSPSPDKQLMKYRLYNGRHMAPVADMLGGNGSAAGGLGAGVSVAPSSFLCGYEDDEQDDLDEPAPQPQEQMNNISGCSFSSRSPAPERIDRSDDEDDDCDVLQLSAHSFGDNPARCQAETRDSPIQWQRGHSNTSSPDIVFKSAADCDSDGGSPAGLNEVHDSNTSSPYIRSTTSSPLPQIPSCSEGVVECDSPTVSSPSCSPSPVHKYGQKQSSSPTPRKSLLEVSQQFDDESSKLLSPLAAMYIDRRSSSSQHHVEDHHHQPPLLRPAPDAANEDFVSWAASLDFYANMPLPPEKE